MTTQSDRRVVRAVGRGRLGLSAQVAGCAVPAVAVGLLTGPTDSASHLLTFLVVTLVGLSLAAFGAWRHRHELGVVGALIVGALFCWNAANAGWVVNVLVLHEEPFPSWTDGLYLLTYPLLMAAALVMVRRREVRRDGAALIDSAIIAVGVGVVAYAFVIVNAWTADSETWLARVVGVVYPLCDVLVVGVVARVLVGTAVHSRAAILLVVAMCSLLAADIGFVVAVFAESAQNYEGWIDALYAMFFLLVGLSLCQRDAATLVQEGGERREGLSPVRFAALGTGALLAPLTMMASGVAGDALKVRGAAIGAAILFLLTMVRMAQLIRTVESKSDLLAVQARTDGLTGLPNRRSFDFELARSMSSAGFEPPYGPVSVGMIDLDRFKVFNDTYGHGAGDDLLRQAATAWSVALRLLAPVATIARYGGEEFAVIMPGMDDESGAAVLRQLLPLTPRAQSFSAGVARWQDDEEPSTTLARADALLYEAKATGRARVVASGGPPREVAANSLRSGATA